MDFMRECLDLLEEPGGLFPIPVCILANAELRHLVNQFGIQEALLAGLGLEDFGLECVDAFLVEGFIVKARGACGYHTNRKEHENGQRNPGLHEGPPQLPDNLISRDYRSIGENVQG
jgi:hypothetical protein